ncbi:MAG: hypothetical protein WC022_03010 [Parcubacteria group bacterium]
MSNENMDNKGADIKTRIMEDIKCKKIKMRSRFVFVLEKLGLEGALFLLVALGAALVSLIFYFIEKTRLEKFLTLGFPGAKVFLVTLPYDYIIFFVLAVALAIYFANQIELFCGNCERTDTFAVWFFLGAIALGIFFGVLGVGSFLGGWSKNKIPRDAAIHGKIRNFMDNEVTVVDEDGDVVRVFLPDSNVPPAPNGFVPDKFLRAVGSRDSGDPTIFYAERVRCCDED